MDSVTNTELTDSSLSVPIEHWSFRHRGLLASIGIVPAVALVLVSVPNVKEGSWLDQGLDSLAWIVFLAGVIIRFWATLYIGGWKELKLVQEGPYSICRNPLYVGSLLMLLSIGLFLDSLTFLAVTSIMILIYLKGTVPAEEERLRRALGRPYVDYCRRVPRFWPRLSIYQHDKVVEVRPKGLRLELLRTARWLLMPLSMQTISHLRELPSWPHLLRLP